MGNTTQTTQSSSTPNATPTDLALQNNELQLSNAALPGQLQNIGLAQNFQSQILQGVGGNLQGLIQGVSPAQSQNEAQLANQGVATQFQQLGGLDSGTAAQGLAQNYANTLNSNAQFNTNNLLQLMNLASGNAAQNITGASNNNSQLGSLALGLTGQSGTSTLTQNPFLSSFYSGLGNMANGQTETQAAGQAASGGGQLFAGF